MTPLRIHRTRDCIEALGPAREVLALLALLPPGDRAVYAQERGNGAAAWAPGIPYRLTPGVRPSWTRDGVKVHAADVPLEVQRSAWQEVFAGQTS
jgi:hypothetical protein